MKIKTKTKKARLIVKSIVCIVLALAILVPATMFSLADNEDIDTTPTVLSSDAKLKYYDFNKGLFTSKVVTGPDENGEYTVTIDTYTSNVTYISAEAQTLDVMVLFDRSGSMLDDGRWDDFKNGLKSVLTSLTDNYKVGWADEDGKVNRTVNLAMIGFSGAVYPNVLDYTEVNSTSVKEGGTIYKKIKKLASPAGGTATGKAFEAAEEKILSRMRKTSNKQIILFFTDGVPAYVTSMSNTNNEYFPSTALLRENEETSKAIAAANRLKAKGVDIYTIGCGKGFDEKPEMSSAENGLAQWVTSGATYTEADNDQTGMKLRPRQIGVFMNMLSSGWIANKGKEEKNYDWQICDKKEAIEIYNKYPGENERQRQERTKLLSKWAKQSDGWQNIPNDYTLNPKVSSNSMQYFFSTSNASTMTQKIGYAFLQSLATVQVSQGSLLGDYIVKDTVSSYFEIVPNSAEFCTVKYEGGYSNASAAKTDNNYGEEDRQWSDVTEITGKDLNWDDKTEITEGITYRTSKDKSYIEILAPVNNSTVIDTCVIDNVADSNNEKHSGNKLRITYKIRPKDSFMGGSSVPTHDYANSGIYKGNEVVQSFDKANSSDTNPVPKMSVELVRPTKITANSNVKIGFLYPAENVGNTDVNVTYQGRYSVNGAYNSYIMNADSGIVYDKDRTEISYGSYTVENDKDDNKSESSAARYFKRKELRRRGRSS